MNKSESNYTSTDLLQFGKALLVAAGLAEERARDIAEVLLEGDLLGHSTHGLALLSPYLEQLRSGQMEKEGEPEVVSDYQSALTWDGRYLPGPWLIRKAIRVARERLSNHPMVSIAIRRSHHIGCLQAYLKPVTDEGLFILLTCSDPAIRVVAPFGGTEPRYSPNPIAAGIPTHGQPLLIDISTSTTAYGTCLRKKASGEPLPGPWLLDKDGHATNDPTVLDQEQGGSILPLGGADLGYKGFALGLIVEALTSGLAGFGRADHETRWGGSMFLQLIDPDRFGGREAFLRETTFFTQYCRSSASPSGKPSVRLPGEAALARRAEQLENGVRLHPSIMPSLKQWADTFQIPVPSGA